MPTLSGRPIKYFCRMINSQDDDPKFGAGSVFGKDVKEEARRKKLGITRKVRKEILEDG